LILRQTRTRQIERGFDVVQAGYGDRQQFRLTITRGVIGMPQRLEMRLQQTPEMQVLQRLQIKAADVDIGAQLAVLRRLTATG
jgi:hypothetical protein